MRIYFVLSIGGCLMLVVGLLAATSLAAAGVDDHIRHVVVTQTEPLSSPALDAKSQAVKDKFLADTVKIRRALAGKQAALQAVYSSRTGNTSAAARLGEEIFDLREQLRVRAQATGLSPALLVDEGGSGYAEENRR